ncbi:LysR family transcriptional regulator [Vibrio sonorensis]|uniref:LysR family transcriptional regulator n=1 Tax=Vibrio sonorensis TaxID=1004316 RepID=UPI0008D9594F|nr:LysR family transcriptional regulator [Vibrio sonorensis]
MDWLQSVQSYIRVVEEGSFNGAARKLDTTSSAISKRVHWLEERIGAQLLKRTTRSVTQTEAGALFYERAKVQIEGWQSIVDETRSVSQNPAGLLKIGATLAVGSKFLVQYLDEFQKLYPDIKILLLTTTPGQLPELSLDLFISREIEQLNSLSFKATPLFEYKLGFYASPDYIERFGKPNRPEDLNEHNVLLYGERPFREFRLGPDKRLTLHGKFTTTNVESLFYAAKAGMGILVSSDVMIKEEVKQGQLQKLLPDVTIDESTVYAYYPKLDYDHTRTQLFLDFIKQRLADE